MSFNFFMMYFLTIFVATIIPGPSMLLALTHGMRYGTKRTTATALGNLIVTLLQAAISMAGLGAVLLASENVFNIIKLIGAAYLIYMGITIWRSPLITLDESDGGEAPQESLRNMFLKGVLVTAGNPKAIVFFTAIFPQFINPHSAYVPQFLTFLITGGIIAFSCFMIYAAGGQNILSIFLKTSVGKHLNKIIAGTFIGAGIGLAVSNK
ncbi:MAG: LysE family translocator [Spirochaetales bacterium]|nr:LysE family translocator [Spirochaetales bacterium]